MAAIDHVVVLALENRSFDHVLGFLDHPDPAFDGLNGNGAGGSTEIPTNPGWAGGAAVPATATAKKVLPIDPDHSHDAVMEQLSVRGIGPFRRATNRGFVVSYERKGRGLAAPVFGGLFGRLLNWWMQRRWVAPEPIKNRGPLAMLCQPPAQVPVLTRLALDFGVCTRWFCSVPGETWPNRNFLHSATSDGTTVNELRFYTDRTIFELLEDHGRDWHIYHDDTPQVWAFRRLWDTPRRHANWFPLSDFVGHVAADRLPAYSFIEPNHKPPVHLPGHGNGNGASISNSQHPGNNLVADDDYDAFDGSTDTDFSRAETLVATIYEALRNNPKVFDRTVFLITYDEHGGLFDHVPPPIAGVPAPGDPRGRISPLVRMLLYRKARDFDFQMLGPRVPALVISPYVPAGTVDRQTRDHASVPATLRALFAPGAPPLTARDGWAAPFHRLLTLAEPRRADLPDLSAHLPGARSAPEGAYLAETDSQPEMARLYAESQNGHDNDVPSHYRDFAQQAELVREHLADIAEPEGVLPTPTSGLRRAAQTSEIFARAARRHRHENTVTPVAVRTSTTPNGPLNPT
jgi:phospholipase C